MKHAFKRLILAVALTGAIGTAAALDPVVNWNPRTGDTWVDVRLGDINQYGSQYRAPFVNEMVRYYGAPRSLVDELLNTRRWTPGDVYYACSLARAAGRPCREVADAYDSDRGQGWGVIAKRMGIKPGSAEFHALKRGIVPTYDRWGRPIVLDDDLRKHFPNRVNGKAKAKAAKSHDYAKAASKSKSAKAVKASKSSGKARSDHTGHDAKGKSAGKSKSKGKG